MTTSRVWLKFDRSFLTNNFLKTPRLKTGFLVPNQIKTIEEFIVRIKSTFLSGQFQFIEIFLAINEFYLPPSSLIELIQPNDLIHVNLNKMISQIDRRKRGILTLRPFKNINSISEETNGKSQMGNTTDNVIEEEELKLKSLRKKRRRNKYKLNKKIRRFENPRNIVQSKMADAKIGLLLRITLQIKNLTSQKQINEEESDEKVSTISENNQNIIRMNENEHENEKEKENLGNLLDVKNINIFIKIIEVNQEKTKAKFEIVHIPNIEANEYPEFIQNNFQINIGDWIPLQLLKNPIRLLTNQDRLKNN
ncbi:coilin [Anaeramoeba flamelloides]|uniref:Coilin n=1 Tax=Anaeramoeba flamelloides TaxID=1746091 RepID=A0AAV8AJP9_9EUKA|nr:coilin [Anaeramoeba flamelloides]